MFLPYQFSTGVTFTRRELESILPVYRQIEDCVSGEAVIKSKGKLYLPDPANGDCDHDSKSRYEDYLKRAVFYNVARHTLSGLVGQVFSKSPTLKYPDLLKPVVDNASGDGVSLIQLARASLEGVLSYSRDGILVDFPRTNSPTSLQDVKTGKIRPTITRYKADQIRNWKVIDIGAEEVPVLIVLLEWHEVAIQDSEFATVMQPWFRVLRLRAEGATVQIYKPRDPIHSFELIQTESFYPEEEQHLLDSRGRPLSRIPFAVIGGTRNSFDVERPTFEDFTSLNLAHYRNSADYEELCFISGQLLLVFSGVSEEWNKKVLNGKVRFGSRNGVSLPVGASAELLQAEARPLLAEAMAAKERQMQAIGAKLVEPERGGAMTATEAKIEATAEGSTLQNAARNVSDRYLWALKLCAELIGQPTDSIEFALNDDFDISKMASTDRQEVRQAMKDGVLSWSEVRSVYRATGIATLDDKSAKTEIEREALDDLEYEIRRERLMNEPQ